MPYRAQQIPALRGLISCWTTSRTQGRHASTSTSQSVRAYGEPAVMDSEIMRLAACNGYLKVATKPDWIQVKFEPMDFPARAKAYVPLGGAD